MGVGRDNFTDETKRRAAGRVAYRCSFPGCSNATIGASAKGSNEISSIGVAAHICAAAPGGPRYDKNMTAEKRKSVENCIWMCQTHAKLIDTDEKTYTVELLKQWKTDAEAAASAALANGDYFSEHYKSNEDNLKIMKQLFDDMIAEGQFNQFHTLLDQYKTTLSEQYEEFIFRYRIIYDVYCDRARLQDHLDAYCNLVYKGGVDTLVELFLVFHLNDELQKVIDFCTDGELSKYAKLSLSDELTKLFFVPVGASRPAEFPAELIEVMLKYATNYTIQNKLLGTIDVNGKKFLMYTDEFYYRAASAAYELAYAAIYGNGNVDDIIAGQDYVFLKENIDRIVLLDPSLQEYIWEQFLIFNSEKPELFRFYYERCPLSVKATPSIEKTYYIHTISCALNSVDTNALLDYISKTGEDTVLCFYLSHIEKKSAIEFLDEHGYLFKKSSSYLKLRLDLQTDLQPVDALSFLGKYTELYKDDFTFRLLLAEHSAKLTDNDFSWFNERVDEIKSYNVIDYIHLLSKHQRWDELISFSQYQLPNEILFEIANTLFDSNDEKRIMASHSMYQQLIDRRWKRKCLYFNLAVTQRSLGLIEEAKANFQNEYDMYGNISALNHLIELRYELNEYLTDIYFDALKRCISAYSQNLVGAIYMKHCNYADARTYFLRSLLLDDIENSSINGFLHAVLHLPQEDVKKIEENVFCSLRSNNGIRKIAIHSTKVMEDIVSPCSFANCTHYSVHDIKISSLLFAEQGDYVLLDGENYEVIEILSANAAITRFFYDNLRTQSGVTVITSSTTEGFKEQITDILKKSTEDLDSKIDRYNRLDIRSPLSVFAVNAGKSMLKTCEFLAFANKEKLRNNLKVPDCKEHGITFVLSYEAIVFLAHLELDQKLKELKLVCSAQVKNQLANDINEELAEIADDTRAATMFYDDGEITIFERTSNMRRSRHAFLTRLKAFLDSLQIITDAPIFTSNITYVEEDIKSIFTKKHLFCEGTSLGATQLIDNATLVTDDQFLYVIANLEGIPNIGLTGLLAQSNLDWRSLLDASKKLKDMNYGNYLPLHFYKRIFDQMLKYEVDREIASAEIQAWVASDTDAEPTEYHEDVVVTLCRTVIEQELNYLNPSNYLLNFVFSVLEKRHPGYIEKCIIELDSLNEGV